MRDFFVLVTSRSSLAYFYRIAPRGVIDSRPRSTDYDYAKGEPCVSVIYRTKKGQTGPSQHYARIKIQRDFKQQLTPKVYELSS